MKWATFRLPSQAEDRVGLVEGDRILPLPTGTRLVDLLGDEGERLRAAAEALRRAAQPGLRLQDVRLRAPIPQPPSIRDFASFFEHLEVGMRNMGSALAPAWFEAPVFYFSAPSGLAGHGETVIAPGDTRKLDYELEVCAVIGRGGRDIPVAEAERHIAGYAICNDWSARDLQLAEMRRMPIGPGKGKDFANGMGPFLVTPDELEDRRSGRGYDLAMTASVNGKPCSRGNWASIHWSFAEMVSFASRSSTLVPGDVIGSGTVGTGCILELAGSHGEDAYPWLQEGDLVELSVERLGTLANRVAFGPAPPPLR